MLSSGKLDDKRSLAYRSFLFLIMYDFPRRKLAGVLLLIIHVRHRAQSIDVRSKVGKLREFIEPVKAQWQSAEIRTSIQSYHGFCQFLGLDKAQRYLKKHQAHQIQDWGSQDLDAEGLALQTELEERLKV